MLENIKVFNIALIEYAEIEFEDGLNILSGETGAGKSIIIDSINFVMGHRASKDYIRKGSSNAYVEAIFYIKNLETLKFIKDFDIEIADDSKILLYRSINLSGKNSCKINGKSFPLAILKAISERLINIHGQHEHQFLLDENRHIAILDKFCSKELMPKKIEISKIILEYKEILRKIKEISKDDSLDSQIEIYEYQIKDIESFSLTKNEEEELEKKRIELISIDKLSKISNKLLNNLSVDGGALDFLSNALEDSKNLFEINKKIDYTKGLNDAISIVSDLYNKISIYSDNIENNINELEKIEEKLYAIQQLKNRYNKSNVSEILDFYSELKKKVEVIINSKDILENLNYNKKILDNKIGKICIEMSKIREKAAKELSIIIQNILQDLGMVNAKFNIKIQRKKEFTSNGIDKIIFQFSANLGSELSNLSEIASGGEMSRVMLALKTALANYDTIETFIFDEIDTGISGRAANQVAEKLLKISKNNQILCITHLPQIAAMGDNNILIEKNESSNSTTTIIKNLNNEEKSIEIARMIAGKNISDISISAANDLINMSNNLKLS